MEVRIGHVWNTWLPGALLLCADCNEIVVRVGRAENVCLEHHCFVQNAMRYGMVLKKHRYGYKAED
eukprot:1158994-Pelagomonas_calceolata.AAC.13